MNKQFNFPSKVKTFIDDLLVKNPDLIIEIHCFYNMQNDYLDGTVKIIWPYYINNIDSKSFYEVCFSFISFSAINIVDFVIQTLTKSKKENELNKIKGKRH